MGKTGLLAFLLFSCVGAALAAPQHGFLIFSSHGVASYAQNEKGELSLAGKSTSGDSDDYIAANGRIYYLHKLLGRVSELGADLKPLRETTVKSKADVPYWLGLWDDGLLILNDNTVIYLDADLNEVARLPLEPRRYDQITPALNPQDFDTWDHRGYLLANTGEVYIIPLQRPLSTAPLLPALRAADGISPEAQWIDAADKTLNLMAKEEREEQDVKLKAGEFRVIKEQVVYTYALNDLAAPARRSVVHEERQIHEPRSLDFDDGERPGMIIDRRPPYRSEGKDKGTYFGIVSRTTPAYAEAFEEKPGQVMPQRRIVRLKSRGRYERMNLYRSSDEGPLWFRDKSGRRYVEDDMEEHVLRLLPEPYEKLKALPELREVYFSTLAY